MRPAVSTFESAWAQASTAEGWLTEDQARVLWHEARALGVEATVLEIGSYQGRSTIVLASGVVDRGGRVVAVDPFVDDWKFGDPRTRARFEAHISASGLDDVVELVADYSTTVRPGWRRPLDLLFIDGKHDVWTVRDDLRWATHVALDGPVLVHDCFSSVGVTLGVLANVLPGRGLRYERRVGSLAVFRRGRPRAADRLRILRELPWWVRNLVVKVTLRLRLRRLTRALGHHSPYDPY
jgi:predicted O-methyltransferase YrrM